MAIQKLILIKHASPEVIPNLPPEQWKLSEKGRASCNVLAERLVEHTPKIIISSTEAKAIETAAIVSARLNISTETAPDIHEHDRSSVSHMRSGEFISMMELFFRQPEELVLGKETAEQAEKRFAAAINSAIEKHASHDSIAVISHGTVIALLLARHSNRNGFQLWRDMGLPSFAVMELPALKVNEVVPRI